MDTSLLNNDVRKALSEDNDLYLVFAARFGFGYDSEITPVHNYDWRECAKKNEAKMLEESRKLLAEIRECKDRNTR